MAKYGYDRIGSMDELKCNECGEIQYRHELELTPRYDVNDLDEDGEAKFVEDYYGCWVCKSEDIIPTLASRV